MKKLLLTLFILPTLIIAQTQIGSDIDGEGAEDRSGFSIYLSSNSDVLVIGAHQNN